MEPWNNLWADLSQGMANSQMEPWNNLWADLSQGMAYLQMEPWNNLWADLSQGMANSQMEPRIRKRKPIYKNCNTRFSNQASLLLTKCLV